MMPRTVLGAHFLALVSGQQESVSAGMPARKLASESACKTQSDGDKIDWTKHNGVCYCKGAETKHDCTQGDHVYCYNGAKWKDIEMGKNVCSKEPTTIDPSSAVSAYGFTALVLVLITV
jgi:hypothetical protein